MREHHQFETISQTPVYTDQPLRLSTTENTLRATDKDKRLVLFRL